ncbi:methenyltetrahydrofolate synthase domain-containing protein [Cricetulus griseus]|nr:methenyltetrahydrofolate synthase domain-containing protein [Cricetulus griseus]
MEALAGVSKQGIRERIWDYMESHDLADFPRPVHHRIPNFKGASRAAEHFPHLHAFSVARTIKVNPDAPQRNVRFLVLESKKTLLVPTPRLRTGLFNKITPPPGATKDILRKCATSQSYRRDWEAEKYPLKKSKCNSKQSERRWRKKMEGYGGWGSFSAPVVLFKRQTVAPGIGVISMKIHL